MTRKTKAQLEQAVQSLEQALRTCNDTMAMLEKALRETKYKLTDPRVLARNIVQEFVRRGYHNDAFWTRVKAAKILNDRDGLMDYVLRSEEFVSWMKENYP